MLKLNNVLFADDMNKLVSGENLNTVQTRLNTVMKDIQTWFTWNNLIVNAEKTLAKSFHTTRIKSQPFLMFYLKAEVFHTTLIQNFWVYT
jgi:hypothetical protein